jgi:hypothetical protein
MSSLRRHLASLGLTMVLCHVVLQVLVPAALCCHQASITSRSEKRATPAKECCPAGAHAGQVCPLHGAKRAGTQAASDCSAEALRDFRDLIVVLNNGGVVPQPLRLTTPTGWETAFVAPEPQAVLVSHVPPGPPPRV